ncbi:MAG: Uncharacterised protein [Pseudidiomarina mangrovi]|nr:MAG: Uncharacterised protein [Pseudidiomarina mangrovi]
MTKQHRQSGFFLPLTVALMMLFSSFWLTQQHRLDPVDQRWLSAIELQQELLFWHRGVLHFYRKHAAWPADLDAVVQSFSLASTPHGVSGVTIVDGFQLQALGVDPGVAEQVVAPLADYLEYRADGSVLLPIRLANATVDNPHLIERAAATPVLMATAIDFSNFGLDTSYLEASQSLISDIHSRDLEVDGSFTSPLLDSFMVITDDLRIGAYSLPAQQQKIELLYEALWYCMNVSERCRNAPQVM